MRISDWSSDVCSSDLYKPGSCTVKKVPNTLPSPNISVTTRICRNGVSPTTPSAPLLDISILQPRTLKLDAGRSEARRVGTECVCKCSSRWSPQHKKTKDIALHNK